MTRDNVSVYLHSILTSDKKSHLKRKYGITFESLIDMIHTQSGQCAICSRKLNFESRHWHVDHDHKTGKVRGILCHFCNTSLLPVFDTYAHLIPAIKKYLGLEP
jgi:hypothetical protein